jgi:rhodanese-related sulfurtransferase
MTVPEITVHDLAALGASARVIDVREVHEWNDAHVAHAELVPLGTVPDRLDAFDGQPTYVICRSGNRSGRACEFLIAQGHDAVNVAGGMLAWVAAGFETVSGESGSVDAGPRG